jgi:hypothetical protein
MKLSTLMIGLAVTGAVGTAIAVPHYQAKQRNRNEANAVGSLRAIANAQSLFREGDMDKDGVLDYAPDLEALVKAGLLEPGLHDGVDSGYRFVVRYHSLDQFIWSATAEPLEPGHTGDRFFGANMAGIIPFSSSGPVEFGPDGAILRGMVLSH